MPWPIRESTGIITPNRAASRPARHPRFGGIGVPIRVMGVQLGASLAGKLSCESLSIASYTGTTRDRYDICFGCWSEVPRAVGVDGLPDPAGEVSGRGVIDLIAELCRATFAATAVALDGVFLAAVTRFGLAFGVLAFVVRCTVVFVAVLLAFVVSLAGCVTNAALPMIFLAFAACLAGRGAAVALLTFLLALGTSLTVRSAVIVRPSFFIAFGLVNDKSTALCGCIAFHAPSKRKLAIAPVGNLPPRGGTSLAESGSASSRARSCSPGLCPIRSTQSALSGRFQR